MVADQNDDLKQREHREKLLATIDYLKNLDLADLSLEDYLAIEESIVRLYVRKQITKAVNDVLRPAVSELIASIERASSLCHEVIHHADRVRSQSIATERATRTLTRERYFSRYLGEEA